MDTFDHTKGFMYIDNTDSEHDDTEDMDFSIFIFDGQYIDKEYAQLYVFLPVSNFTFNQTNAYFSKEFYEY